jgi:hypothetical protein
MTQVLTPQKEAELEQTPSGPGPSSKRRIAHAALAAAVIVAGFVAVSAGGPDLSQSQQDADAVRWEAPSHHYVLPPPGFVSPTSGTPPAQVDPLRVQPGQIQLTFVPPPPGFVSPTSGTP